MNGNTSNITTSTKANTQHPLKHISACVTYCKHTSTKLAMSTGFSNSPTMRKHKLIASEHPLFSLPLSVIYNVFGESTTPTEKYISMTAYLVNIGVLNTKHMGLVLDVPNYEIVHDAFKEFLYLTVSLVHDTEKLKQLELPTLVVNSENQCSGNILKTHIQWCGSIIEANSAGYFARKIKEEANKSGLDTDLLNDLYQQADDERVLIDMLSNRRKSSSGYSKKLGSWAVKSIARNTSYTKDTLDSIRFHIFADSDRLRTDNLRDIIKLVKDGLTYEDYEREQSLLVIRMLESKLEDIINVEQSFGFTEVSFAKSVVKDALIEYQIATGTKSLIGKEYKVATHQPLGTTPLERLRNKFKRTSK